MVQRLPFYMVYDAKDYMADNNWNTMRRDERFGRNTIWDDDRISNRDYEYMKSAYPDTAKRIMPYIEVECDRMEYSGSMLFDEYPDQVQLRIMCRRISKKIREDAEMEGEGKWLEDLIHVLVWHEIMKRRVEYRKYRRKLY